jgi:RimJ/RimL family protein N-acetyltransferase
MSGPRPASGAPQRVVLPGRYVRLEPLDPRHAADLYRAASAAGADDRFRWLFESPPASEDAFAQWVATASASHDPLMFAVVDSETGRAGGRQALMRIVPEHGVIEIGSIMWGPDIIRSRRATEALYLFARHIFEDLGYRRFEWKCNAVNEPSRRAAARFGFTYEGTFRQHMIVKGQSRDTAWFAMLDGDWPRLRAEYDRWLDPANFRADGLQKTKLQAS